MTNEEKAKEIAEKTIVDASTSFLGWINEMSTNFCVWSALEMAEWKDNQFRKYLEDLSKKYLDEAIVALNNHDENQCEFLNGKVNVLVKILDELFNK